VPEILHFFNIGLWPIIMGVTMYLQQKLNPQPTDPVQARVFQFLPILFTFMLAPFSAGLVIYWAWSNILSIAQQYYIMRKHGAQIGGKAKPATAAAVPAPAAAPGGGGSGGGNASGGKKGGKGAAKKG
jgi:YidC/Oxa1 family membrane protein insertase